jgi:2-keto-4-pentenoate hydratase
VTGDKTQLVRSTNATGCVVTIPATGTVAFPVYTVLSITQDAATGVVTLTGATGVTLDSPAGLQTRAQRSTIYAVQIVANEWLLTGDLSLLGQTIKTITGTTYTLVTGDAWGLVRQSHATGTTVSIPTNANVAFPTGVRVDFEQVLTGQLVITGATGVTVSGTPTTKGRAQYSALSAMKIDTDTWWVAGDAASA